MKIIPLKLNLWSDKGTDTIYKFRIEIPSDNLTLVETVRDWANDTGFNCLIQPGRVYVSTLEDASWFLLRWA